MFVDSSQLRGAYCHRWCWLLLCQGCFLNNLNGDSRTLSLSHRCLSYFIFHLEIFDQGLSCLVQSAASWFFFVVFDHFRVTFAVNFVIDYFDHRNLWNRRLRRRRLVKTHDDWRAIFYNWLIFFNNLLGLLLDLYLILFDWGFIWYSLNFDWDRFSCFLHVRNLSLDLKLQNVQELNKIDIQFNRKISRFS